MTCVDCGNDDLVDGVPRKKGTKIPDNEAQADHDKPLADGGEDDHDTNGKIRCAKCHKEKTREENRARAKARRQERERTNIDYD